MHNISLFNIWKFLIAYAMIEQVANKNCLHVLLKLLHHIHTLVTLKCGELSCPNDNLSDSTNA